MLSAGTYFIRRIREMPEGNYSTTTSYSNTIVADGQKIPQVICTVISRLNIRKSGRSFYAIFLPVYIELSLR